jgi:hypothetical protein
MLDRDRLSLYFWGRKNKIGMLGAVAGCGVVAAGLVAGPFALFIPPALYAAGALVTPTEQRARLQISNSSDMRLVKRDLDRLCDEAEKQLPSELAELVDETQGLIGEILERTQNVSRTANPELHTVRQTAVDYLPTALNEYLSLPTDYATRHKNQLTGRTAEQELEMQLKLIRDEMRNALNAILDGNVSNLVSHGIFLREHLKTSEELSVEE